MNCEEVKVDALGKSSSARVLVTGGAGFIGRHLVAHLVRLGNEVTSLGGNRDDANLLAGAHYIFGDLSLETLQTVDFVPEEIFHLAGGASVPASLENPPLDFLKTVYSTVVLLDFVRRHWPEARVVYVSSAAVYGEATHKKAHHDLAPLPISPYGVHKKHVESLFQDHARLWGTRSVIVRPFSVYGPGLRKQVLWDAMERAIRGQYDFFGTGREQRDWVYVADLVVCLMKASQFATAKVPVFNAGTCQAVSVQEVLSELFDVAGFNRAPVFKGAAKEGDPDRLVAGDSAEAVLGPLFVTPLREGLVNYVAWYRSRDRS